MRSHGSNLWLAAVLVPSFAFAVILLVQGRARSVARRTRALHRLCEALPKVELHAHLHGCARLSTIAELAPASVDTSALRIAPKDDRSLDACFAIFGAIHQTVTNLDTVRRVTREVLADFAADNVKYLELRTTPRALSDADVEGYVRALLDELTSFDAAQARDTDWPMTVRLLLSVDRTGGADRAMATVQLAARLRTEPTHAKYIVGMDFSGNPTRSSFAEYAHVFEAARSEGLKVAVHVGEVDHAADTEAVVSFRPERLGHALLLPSTVVEHLQAHPIPIELCPTSNLKTLQLGSLEEHPTMSAWLSSGYPVSISTDDSSVFNTTSSRELALTAIANRLSPDETAQLAAAALNHVFEADPHAVHRLRYRFHQAIQAVVAAYHDGVFDGQP